MEKTIELKTLCDFGSGRAKIGDMYVEIEVKGISGSMKAWLVGGEEAEKIGNLVGGKLHRSIDTTRHNGILITQSGRQLLCGKYGEDEVVFIKEEKAPFKKDGIVWQKITEKSYRNLCEELRYILSSNKAYQNYKKYGHYWAGESETDGVLAFKYEENDDNPLSKFGDMCLVRNGYVTVCVDKKTKKLKKLF